MAEENKGKFIVRSVRAPEEALDFLKELGEREFANQGEALKYLMNLWNLESAKKSVGREKEIEDFQHLIGRLGEMYVQSLSLCADTEERVAQDFAERLENQERTIAELRMARDEAKDELAKLRLECKDKDDQIAVVEKQRDEAKADAEMIKADHNRLQQAIDNANASNDDLRSRLDLLKDAVEDNQRLSKEIEGIRQKNQELSAEYERLEKSQQNMIDKAVNEAVRKCEEKRYKIMDDYIAIRNERDSLAAKIRELEA